MSVYDFWNVHGVIELIPNHHIARAILKSFNVFRISADVTGLDDKFDAS